MDISKYIIENTLSNKIDKNVGVNLLKLIKNNVSCIDKDIAVIGIAVDFPMASDVDEYWSNLCNGRDCIKHFPKSRKVDIDNYLRYINTDESELRYVDGAYLDKIDGFDYSFFNISPNEAKLMDPFQRLFLMNTWKSLEDAGYSPEKVNGANVGVYVGYAGNSKDCYNKFIFDIDRNLIKNSLVGNITAMMPTRIAYFLNLKGPTMVIDTACSSSLVAVHLACKGILNGDCDMAIAGGVKINLLPQDVDFYKLGIESSDDRARTFDNSSDGTGIGEGVASIILKPLKKAEEDGDNIYAIIKGSAINQDGKSMGITAPNPASQCDVITRAWKDAGVSPEEILYIEAHGTGTTLGDPIEVDGIERAFSQYTDKKQFCAIGSVKTNIGHLYECSGIAGLIKVILSLKNRYIPPHINLEFPNEKISFENSPLYINRDGIRWDKSEASKICGISSFGFGGTNCHMILEEAHSSKDIINKEVINEFNVLTLSAMCNKSMESLINNYNRFLNEKTINNINDFCYTANIGRGHYNIRLAIIFKDIEDLKEKMYKLSYLNLDNINEQWFSYNIHKIVSSNKNKYNLGEITEKDKIMMNELADVKMKEYISNKSVNSLKEVCDLYTKGADVEWMMLYSDMKVKKMSLPTYPFNLERCWIDIPKCSKKINRDEDYFENKYFDVKWEKCDDTNLNIINITGPILVFCDKNELSERIGLKYKSSNQEVFFVRYGKSFRKISNNEYVVGNSVDDYVSIMQLIKDNNITDIIHLMSITDNAEVTNISELESSQNRGLYSLYYFVKAFSIIGIKNRINLVLISKLVNEVTKDEARINPENATLLGLGKVVCSENPFINVQAIDIDDDSDIENVLGNLNNDDVYLSAYRHNQRYIQIFDYMDIDKKNDRKLNIKDKGVYVITGGTGSIGLETAKLIATKGKANIVLINRSLFPSREKWNDIVKLSNNKNLNYKISKICEIEALGSNIDIRSCNVTDYEKMKKLINDLRECYGNINGIFHCAGVAGDGFIELKEEKTLRNVVEPKVKGAWILHNLTKNDNLDLFVMYSSLASLCNTAGQGDYIAANSYLDSFTYYRNKCWNNTLTINWSTWKEVGMAKNYGVNNDASFKALSTKQAIVLLDKLLQKNVGRAVVGEINYSEATKYLTPEVLKSNFPINLSDKINKLIGSKLKKDTDDVEIKDIKIKGRETNNYSDIELIVANIWAEVLGFYEIDISADFYDLGGDSINGLKIINMINQKLNKNISIADLFANPTIEELVQAIDNVDIEVNSILNQHIMPVKNCEYYPVSSSQEGLYMLSQLDGIGTAYNLPGAIMLEGKVDKERIQRAVNNLIQRHEILRSSFHIVDGNVVQKVHNDIECIVNTIVLDEKQLSTKMNEIFTSFVKPFDFEKAPLFRALLIEITKSKYILMYDIHHIVTDGTSNNIIEQDFLKLYLNEELPDIRIQYKDFAVWQKNLLSLDLMKKEEEYWLNKFSEEIPHLDLPTDYPRSNKQSFEGNNKYFVIDKDLSKKIKDITVKTDSTLYMVLLASMNILLWKYTRQDDIIIGSPISGRYNPDLNSMVGMLVNTLVMRNNPSGELKFSDFITIIKENTLEAYKNQHYPFEKLVSKLPNRKDLSRNALFDVMLVLHNMENVKVDTGDLNVCRYNFENRISNNVSKFDMTWSFIERESEIQFGIEYCTSLFKESTIERFSKCFIKILREITDDIHIKLNEISILDDEEKNIILENFNDTECSYDKSLTIPELFERQVQKTPNNIAVVSYDNQYTYKELSLKVNNLAYYLKEKGISNESIVGILMDHSSNMILAMLAVLKAGGAYVPIEKEYPDSRIEYMLKDSNVKLLIYDYEENRNINYDGIKICINDFNMVEDKKLNNISKSTDLDYIIYTSGTTGKPKGVMVEHRNTVAYIKAFQNEFNVGEQTVMLQQASASFDVFIEEVYPIITSGGKIVIPRHNEILDLEKLSSYINKYGINIITCSPLLLNELNKLNNIDSVKIFISGGDVFKPEYVSNLCKQSTIYNTYGPTEGSVCCTYYRYNPLDYRKYNSIPIGKPISNYQVYVLDSNLNMLPIGVPGELCISGEGVVRGYINNKEADNEHFVVNPFNKEQRMYKTGDLVKWLDDGNIEFIGRIDRQVKIRGYRVELTEIEKVIAKYEGVNNVVVVDRQDRLGNKYLCAYIISDDNVNINELKVALLRVIPEYMIPAFFVKIDKMPRNINGKVDKSSLPDPVPTLDLKVEYVAPRNIEESMIINVWEEVLGINNIGINNNFFDLGGNSIKAIQVVSKLKETFDVNINQLFEFQTVKDLANNIGYKKDTILQTSERLDYLLNDVQYDYDSNELAMYKNNSEKYKDIDLSEIIIYKNILLTGSTGYLGAYILKDLLEETDSNVYMLVRGKDYDSAKEKVYDNFGFYFGKDLIKSYEDRIFIINGDLCADKFGLDDEKYSKLSNEIDCIINSAANIKYYGDYNEISNINVNGVCRLGEFALENKHKDFNQISTISIGMGNVKDKKTVLFTENDVNVGQNIENYYVKSKFEAEKYLQTLKDKGINVNIFRVGSLMFNSKNGVFQKNIDNNNFYKILKSTIKLGIVPELKELKIDFSYVDYVSKGVVSLFNKKKLLNETYHLYNSKLTNISQFIQFLNTIGYEIATVSISDYINILFEKYKKDELRDYIDYLLNTISTNKDNLTKFDLRQEKTNAILSCLSFEWKEFTIEEAKIMMNYCKSIHYL
ncbi:MAG: amino acid adenylation domain-containing protein [Clostridium sp.]